MWKSFYVWLQGNRLVCHAGYRRGERLPGAHLGRALQVFRDARSDPYDCSGPGPTEEN